MQNQDISIINKLKSALERGQAVRLGEATAVSTKVHGNDVDMPGIIKIFTDNDAGQVYLKDPNPNQYLHMDVFYQPGKFNLQFVALRVWEKLAEYLDSYK